MIKNLLDLLGLKTEIENDFKKISEFPKTLFTIGGISLIILILNTLIDFIHFNELLNYSLYALVIVVLILAISLKIKTNIDFKKTLKEANDAFWNEYTKFYNDAIKNKKIEDVDFDNENNKLSRKLDFECVSQEITEEMIKKFLNLTLQNKDNEDIIIPKEFPMENWDIYQIYGLKMAYITANKATLFMKQPLPNPEDTNNIDVIMMYLNAISTLTKENQKLYKKQANEERKIIDVEPIPTFIPEAPKKEEKQVEKDIRDLIENDDRFKGKDISEIIEVLDKMKKENK